MNPGMLYDSQVLRAQPSWYLSGSSYAGLTLVDPVLPALYLLGDQVAAHTGSDGAQGEANVHRVAPGQGFGQGEEGHGCQIAKECLRTCVAPGVARGLRPALQALSDLLGPFGEGKRHGDLHCPSGQGQADARRRPVEAG